MEPDVGGQNPASDVLGVGVTAPAAIRPRALWALESLLAVAGIAWREVAADEAQAPDIGVGMPGSRLTLELDPDSWQQSREMPAGQDVLAAAFWWLARVEEWDPPVAALDRHGRFDPAASARRGVVDRAPVDLLALRLLEDLGARPAAWAGDHPFAVALTHDIDTPIRWTPVGRRRALRRLRDAVRAGDWQDARRVAIALAGIPAWKLRGSDPHRNEQSILALERRYGARSTSYLLAGHHHQLDGPGDAYDPIRAALSAAIIDAGGEVGLHGSYTASEVPARLVEERLRLEEDAGTPIAHHRFHFLRHRPDRDWPRLDRAGLATDASLGYASEVGMRSGFSYPYRAWDRERNRPLSLLVVPLVLMDATLDDPRYGGLDAAAARPRWEWLVDHARERGAGVSVLWHNDRLYRRLSRGWDGVYEDLLEALAGAGGWLVPVGELAGQWQQRLARAAWSDGVAVPAGERRGIPQQ